MELLAETRERLLREDPTFRHLAQKHQDYDRRLHELRERRYPSEEEKLEEVRLKKLKLSLKDEMERIVRERATEEDAR